MNPGKAGVVIVAKQGRAENSSCTDAAVVTYMLVFFSESYKSCLVEINLAHGYLGIPLI